MTKEQVIEQLKSLKADRESFIQNDKEHDKFFLDDIEAIEIVLSMLEEQDKTIDLMSETINNYDIDEDVCKQMGQKANCNEYEDAKECKECIKQYFINKAKEIR